MGGGSGNDIWGWTDTDSSEYALMGMTNGLQFVRIDDPENPVLVGKLPTQTNAATWRDVKVYNNHAYIVADRAGAHGVQIFDLTRLRGVTDNPTYAADAVYNGIGSAHNIAINEDTGFAYAVGAGACNDGFQMINIQDQLGTVCFSKVIRSNHIYLVFCVILN